MALVKKSLRKRKNPAKAEKQKTHQMTIKTQTRWAGAAFVALALTLLPTTSQATLLAPNTSVGATTGTFTNGTLSASTSGIFVDVQSLLGGSYQQSVYEVANIFAAGQSTQDFYYRFTINLGAITNGSAVKFSIGTNKYTTDVSYLDTAGMAAAFALTGDAIFAPPPALTAITAPTSFSRTLSGTSVGFTYAPNEIGGTQVPETTFVLRIRTDAPNVSLLKTGDFSVQADGSVEADVYEPRGTPVPEPGSAIFGCALLGTVLSARKRKALVLPA
jgi:hypothetical protein